MTDGGVDRLLSMESRGKLPFLVYGIDGSLTLRLPDAAVTLASFMGGSMGMHRAFVLAFVLLSAPAVAQANAPTLKAELSARYADMKSAMASKDESAIRSLLARGFVSVDIGGKSEGAVAMIKEIMALPADPSRQSHTTIVSVRRAGDTAVVEQRYEMTKTAKTADGSDKSVELTTLSRDNWVNDKGVWRIARSVTERLDYSIDGVTAVHKVNPLLK